MPIPKPKKGESKKDFVDRFMGNPTMVKDFPDPKQRRVIAEKEWKKKMKANKSTAVVPQRIVSVMQVNSPDLLRHEMHDGKEFIVGPVVLIKEGVWNGCLYLEEELSKFPKAWDGRPLPVFHPQDYWGDYVSANDPKIIEKQSVGFIFNVHWDSENKKLKGEVWVDVEKAGERYPEVLQMLQNKQMIEVSTGLFTDDEWTEGEWNGKHYDRIVRNFRPDHLALLPKGLGACSISDGAGFPRANELKSEGNFSERLLDRMKKLVARMTSNEQSFSQIERQLHSKLMQEVNPASNPEGPHIFLEEVFSDQVLYEVYSGDEDVKLFLRDYKVQQEVVEFTAAGQEVQKVISFEPVSINQQTSPETPPAQEEQTNMDKEKFVNDLIANEDTAFTEDDKEYLMGKDEAFLQKLVPKANEQEEEEEEPTAPAAPKQKPQANASDETVTMKKSELRSMIEEVAEEIADKKIHSNTHKDLIGRLAANSACDLTPEELDAMPDSALIKLEKKYAKDTANFGGQLLGMSGGFQANDDEEVLEIPSLLPAAKGE